MLASVETSRDENVISCLHWESMPEKDCLCVHLKGELNIDIEQCETQNYVWNNNKHVKII